MLGIAPVFTFEGRIEGLGVIELYGAVINSVLMDGVDVYAERPVFEIEFFG